jgi:hypothetical protein
MADKRHSIGSTVRNTVGQVGIVISHGRDAAGIYTCVRYPNGQTEKWHRSCLTKDTQAQLKRNIPDNQRGGD